MTATATDHARTYVGSRRTDAGASWSSSSISITTPLSKRPTTRAIMMEVRVESQEYPRGVRMLPYPQEQYRHGASGGFSWGFKSMHADQLAFALLAFELDELTAILNYQEYARQIVYHLPLLGEGELWRISGDDIRQWVEQYGVQPHPPAAPTETERRKRGRPAKISPEQRRVVLTLLERAPNRAAAINAAAAKLNVTKETIRRIWRERNAS